MADQPLVTIGVANHNYARYISSALDSVAAQDYDNLEIIIIDDFSNDASEQVIEKWIADNRHRCPIRFIKNDKNLGVAKVCNLILQEAKGKYYQPLDADDLLLPHKIKEQVVLLEKNPKAGLVYSNTDIIGASGELVNSSYLSSIGYDEKNMPSGKVFRDLFRFNFIPNSSVLINTYLAGKIGGYDESLQVQDYYLYLSMAENFDLIYMPGVTAHYRVHQNSLSNTNSSNARSIEAEMRLLYRYYNNVDEATKKEIKRNIHYSANYLYEFRHPSAAFWLKTDLKLNGKLKTFFYFLALKTGIPFSFFKALKTMLHK